MIFIAISADEKMNRSDSVKKLVKKVITAVFAVAMMMGLMAIPAFAEDREVTVTVKWDAAEAENKTIYAWCWSTFENYTESQEWPGDAMTRNEDGTWTTTIHAMFNEKKLGFIPSFKSSLPIYINGIPYDYYIQTVDLEIPSSGNVLITVSEEIDPESEWELHLATVEYDGPEWEYEILDDQSVTIQGYLGNEKEIVVPSEIDGHAVKSIASWAFSCCSSISSVTIPESVTEIGYGAFLECSGLQSIILPSGITSIGEDVFEGCNSLVIYGYSDSYVESYTKENNIPFVPLDKEQNYGNVLCGGTCGENSTYLLYDSGTLVISGSGEITRSYFSRNQEIKMVIVNEGISSIGDFTFYNCRNLTSINLPSGIKDIGVTTFSGCSSMTSIEVDNTNEYYSSVEGVLYNKDITNLVICPEGKDKITIPDSVTSIGAYAFENCSSLTEITLSSGITIIGDLAFAYCTSLSSIIIPETVTKIGGGAFYGCTSLSSITIPTSVTEIDWDAFRGCTSLRSITIPTSVTNIEKDAFTGTKWLEDRQNESPYVVVNNMLIDVEKAGNNLVIPEGVTSICCEIPSTVESIIIPETFTEIGSYAFSSCTSLRDITIPESVTYIDDGTFCYCTSLRSITIPTSVTYIGRDAFYGCTSLRSMTIPETVTKIGKNAFAGCDNLTIYCYSGSYAEEYAKSSNTPYKLITEPCWKQNSTGWWYDNGDGTYPKSTWQNIDGSWYYFNNSGYMVTGWLQDGNKWYYLESTGKMATGWKQISGSWYYFESSGVMAANKWVNSVYYMKANGVMATNEWVDGGKYYVDSNGKWIPNKIKASWKKDVKGWWYDNGDGTYPKSAWKSIDGNWYYFNNSGYMVTGWLNDGGKWYYLETSGKMATSKWINGTYYVKANGVMATNEWVDGGRYYVDANGKWVA